MRHLPSLCYVAEISIISETPLGLKREIYFEEFWALATTKMKVRLITIRQYFLLKWLKSDQSIALIIMIIHRSPAKRLAESFDRTFWPSPPWEVLWQVFVGWCNLYLRKSLLFAGLWWKEKRHPILLLNLSYPGIVLGMVLKSSKDGQWSMRDAM